MITMSNFGAPGGPRLGNQLFQYVSLLGLAKKYQTKLVLPKWEYTQYFKGEFPEGEIPGGTLIQEPEFSYTPNWPQINEFENVDLRGYFQSEKYWQNAIEEVKQALEFKDEFKKQVMDKFVSTCNNRNPFEKPTIAISVRRGDYVGNANYAQIPVTYYILALLERFPNWRESSIILFSDDIPWTRVHFESLPNVYFSENNSDIEDICLMSCMDSFILTNSTFAFWGCYLAQLQRPVKVVRPNHHFSGKLLIQNDIKDYYNPKWEVFDHLNEWGHNKRIDLRDTCFTIPVAYDHPDRKQNLNLCIKLLRKNFDTNIIVYEQGTEPLFKYLEGTVEKYHFDTYNGKFHRTKMLNEMALATNCKYIYNFDADIVIAPLQILEATNQLRNGASMVYPYKWAFARIPRKPWIDKIWNFEDIGIVGDTKFSGMDSGDAISLGGAVGFNRQKFIEGGMENENFISYGPEDVERKVRFEKLGYRIERSRGATMYHINHYVGPNSSYSNPDYDKNAKEFEKVDKMTKEELQEYIKTWPWLPNRST